MLRIRENELASKISALFWYCSAIAFCLPLTLVSGCSTVAHGTGRNLTIQTSPSGASCTLERDEETIGVVESTPEEVTLSASRHDIVVTCRKDGYLPGSLVLQARNHPSTGLDYAYAIGLITPVGWASAAIDAATGAEWEYNLTTLSMTLRQRD
jgi:hypothetical protein